VVVLLLMNGEVVSFEGLRGYWRGRQSGEAVKSRASTRRSPTISRIPFKKWLAMMRMRRTSGSGSGLVGKT